MSVACLPVILAKLSPWSHSSLRVGKLDLLPWNEDRRWPSLELVSRGGSQILGASSSGSTSPCRRLCWLLVTVSKPGWAEGILGLLLLGPRGDNIQKRAEKYSNTVLPLWELPIFATLKFKHFPCIPSGKLLHFLLCETSMSSIKTFNTFNNVFIMWVYATGLQ